MCADLQSAGTNNTQNLTFRQLFPKDKKMYIIFSWVTTAFHYGAFNLYSHIFNG